MMETDEPGEMNSDMQQENGHPIEPPTTADGVVANANADADAAAAVGAATSTSDRQHIPNDDEKSKEDEPEPKPEEEEEDLRVNMQPTYNISEVRQSLACLLEEIRQFHRPLLLTEQKHKFAYECKQSYLATLKLLYKITDNLVKYSDEKYRQVKCANESIQKKILPFKGAIQYLQFLGFQPLLPSVSHEHEGLEHATAEHNNDSTFRISSFVVDPTKENRVKSERANTIVQKVIDEHQITEDEFDEYQTGPIDRQLKVMEWKLVMNENLAPPDAPAEEKMDTSSLMRVAVEEYRRNYQAMRTDKIVMKSTLEEQKAALRRKYNATLVRVVSGPDNTCIAAYFRPWEKIESLFVMLDELFNTQKYNLQIPPTLKITREPSTNNSKFQLAKSTIPTTKKTFQQCGLVPAATLYAYAISEQSDSNSIQSQNHQHLIRPEINEQRLPMQQLNIPSAINLEEIESAKRKLLEEAPKELKSQGSSSRTTTAKSNVSTHQQATNRLASMLEDLDR